MPDIHCCSPPSRLHPDSLSTPIPVPLPFKDGLKYRVVPSCYHSSLPVVFSLGTYCFFHGLGGAASPYNAKHHLTFVLVSLWISHRLRYYVLGIQYMWFLTGHWSCSSALNWQCLETLSGIIRQRGRGCYWPLVSRGWRHRTIPFPTLGRNK